MKIAPRSPIKRASLLSGINYQNYAKHRCKGSQMALFNSSTVHSYSALHHYFIKELYYLCCIEEHSLHHFCGITDQSSIEQGGQSQTTECVMMIAIIINDFITVQTYTINQFPIP